MVSKTREQWKRVHRERARARNVETPANKEAGLNLCDKSGTVWHRICQGVRGTYYCTGCRRGAERETRAAQRHPFSDRKSTRLNSSHQIISYAVFSLKKNTAPTPTLPVNLDLPTLPTP